MKAAELFDITGRVALVTGASSGLGQQFARALADNGAAVALVARRTDRLRDLAQEIEAKGGKAVAPSAESFQAAASNADWAHAPGYYLILTDQAGAASWPITGASFILVYATPPNAAETTEALKFFDWAYKSGDSIASGLEYIPLPDAVKAAVRGAWHSEIKRPDGKPVM